MDPLNLSEQPASLEPRLDGVGNSPMYQDDYMTFSAGQDEPMNRSRPGSSQYICFRPAGHDRIGSQGQGKDFHGTSGL